MNHEHLSNRLMQVANYIPLGARLADIGSDHAYLPCFLVLQQRIPYAVAGEVVKGPFELAQLHVAQNGLANRITVRLADGFMAVEADDRIDTVSICGMGGDLITSILERGRIEGKLNGVTTIVAQPNVDEHQVRRWLMHNGYAIVEETILEENGKIYEIIVGKLTDQLVDYTAEQLQFGVFLPIEKTEAFIKKWTREMEKYDKIIGSLQHANTDTRDKIAHFNAIKQQIKEMIA